MALNLVRNSKVYFTTNLDSNNKVAATGFLPANTFEVQVLDGFTFSQNTNNETVTIMEAGAAPTRGQRAFNTSLAPVDFSFSTYIRPKNITTAISAEESVLWNALFSDQGISTANTITVGGTISGVTYAFSNGVGTVTIAGTSLTTVGLTAGDTVVIGGITATAPAASLTSINAAATFVSNSGTAITLTLTNPTITATTITTPAALKLYKSAWAPVSTSYSYVSTSGSDKHQLQKFGMIFIVDQVAYAVDNAAMGQVSVDFGLDAIATAAWTGQGTTLRQLGTGVTASAGTFGNGLTGTYTAKVTDAQYITNKLSTVSMTLINSLKDSTGATQGAAGDVYTIPITGGNITINNNITYLTPANLGVVNTPIGYYTGARSITGSLTAYLRTGGTRDTGELLSDMLNAASVTIEPMAALAVNIGGPNTVKVVLDMPATTIQVPTVNVAQVVTTEIKFTAEGMLPSATADGNVFDLTKTNDIAIRYYA